MNDSRENPVSGGGQVGLEDIQRLLPHRYPFLLIDRVESWTREPEKTITALKNVTFNEPFFQGHFPGHPVMPGVLVIEAMAQAAGVLGGLCRENGDSDGSLYYLAKVDRAKFNRTVVPGDQLILQVTELRRLRNMGQFDCLATVDGKRVASCQILCAGRS